MPKDKKSSDDKEEKKESGDETTEKDNESSDKTEKSQEDSDKYVSKKERDGILEDLKNTRTELKKLKDEKDKEQEKELEEKEKFKELAEKREKEKEQVNQQLETERKLNAFISVASAEGAVNPEDAFALTDKSEIQTDDDGNVDRNSVKKVVEQLKEDKDYLFSASGKKVGSPSSPDSDEGTKRTYKESEIQDAKFFRENEEDILKAQDEGRIEYDVTGSS